LRHSAANFEEAKARLILKPLGKKLVTPRFGIDTSILVRLVTGDPDEGFQQCVSALTLAVRDQGAEIFASNQVIGEAYIALQHHYGVTKPEARNALAIVLRCGLVAPLNGHGVFDALSAKSGCGLLDRLIADDYRRAGLITLTLDRKMAALPDTRLI
jgi:predicted nucleic acid-binding protein